MMFGDSNLEEIYEQFEIYENIIVNKEYNDSVNTLLTIKNGNFDLYVNNKISIDIDPSCSWFNIENYTWSDKENMNDILNISFNQEFISSYKNLIFYPKNIYQDGKAMTFILDIDVFNLENIISNLDKYINDIVYSYTVYKTIKSYIICIKVDTTDTLKFSIFQKIFDYCDCQTTMMCQGIRLTSIPIYTYIKNISDDEKTKIAGISNTIPYNVSEW